MNSLPETATPSRDADTASPRLISGGRALGIFALLVAVLGGILLLTHKDHPTAPSTTNHHQTGTFALTNSQAIERFKELNRMRIAVFRQRDLSLLAEVVTSDSPLRRGAYRDVARLRRDHVFDKTTYKTREILARSNQPDRIVLRQTELERPRFVTEGGRDVSRMHATLLVVTDWTLHRDGSVWKIFNSSSVSAQRLGQR